MNNLENTAKPPIFCLENISFAFQENPQRLVLNNIYLELYPGQNIGLRGKNGSGKTTLFRCVTGLVKPRSGKIYFYGKPVINEKDYCELRKKVGFVLQDADDQLFFPSVKEDIAFGPLNLGLSPEEAQARVMETLDSLGLAGYGDRLSVNLSGGERKLVAIASILAMRPDALLLDEPLNELDDDASLRLLSLLKKHPCAKIIISHNANFLREVCTDILEMKNGNLHPY